MMSALFEKGVICTSYANTQEEMEQIEELYRKMKDALAAPPRNGDVGTAEEQDKEAALLREELKREKENAAAKQLHDEWWKRSGNPGNWNHDETATLKWMLEKAKGEKDGSDSERSYVRGAV